MGSPQRWPLFVVAAWAMECAPMHPVNPDYARQVASACCQCFADIDHPRCQLQCTVAPANDCTTYCDQRGCLGSLTGVPYCTTSGNCTQVTPQPPN